MAVKDTAKGKHQRVGKSAKVEAKTAEAPARVQHHSTLSEDDIYLFNEGTHARLYEHLGAHIVEQAGKRGAHFAVWAPNAAKVSVVGNFNGWKPEQAKLRGRGSSGIWEGFVEGIGRGEVYKYHITSQQRGYSVEKADPFAFAAEVAPKTASVVWPIGDYEWSDADWMKSRGRRNSLAAPISIYELHIGSWMKKSAYESFSYRELAPQLAEYLLKEGFTHVELLPVMEHPLYRSWGYQTTGYFAPTSRFGTPQDFMFFIDHLHQQGIGVILDWVPSHFPSDEHSLGYFDGTHLYEHADPRLGFHPDWKSLIFNYNRNEVRSFLISSACFWMDKYHADGLRVDAVASMLYRDYSRKEGEWIPNEYGGRENIEAIEFLRQLNSEIYRSFPDIQSYAEESTAWPMVSRPTYVGGLGFGFKWDMGWMHDTLHYLQREPVHRRYHHNEITFRAIYQFTENYVLPLSHDEVVHGKGSLLSKMPGDHWQRFANLRMLLSYQWCCPGKKLLFMGGELGQPTEWNQDGSLDWHLENEPAHGGVQQLVAELNSVYRREPALHELDSDAAGFEWIDCNDVERSVLVFLRKGRSAEDTVLCAFNFTPSPRYNYLTGAPAGGIWREIFNSDAASFGGTGIGNLGQVEAAPINMHGRSYALNLTLPPLAAVLLKPVSAAASGGGAAPADSA